MKVYWLVIGDIHNDIRRLHEIPELPDAEGILVTGDLTMAQGISKAENIIAVLEATRKKFFAQAGNMDKPEITAWLEKKGLNMHLQTQLLSFGVPCLGLGYSTVSPFNTPGEFPEEQFQQWLKYSADCIPSATLGNGDWIFASHTPPYRSTCDRIGNGTHVGSPSVRSFIEQYQPAVCFCGHIHESANVDTIGRTKIINPGPLAAGGYALLHLELSDGTVKIKADHKSLD